MREDMRSCLCAVRGAGTIYFYQGHWRDEQSNRLPFSSAEVDEAYMRGFLNAVSKQSSGIPTSYKLSWKGAEALLTT